MVRRAPMPCECADAEGMYLVDVHLSRGHDVVTLAFGILLLGGGKCGHIVTEYFGSLQGIALVAPDSVDVKVTAILTEGEPTVTHSGRAELLAVGDAVFQLSLDVAVDEHTHQRYLGG